MHEFPFSKVKRDSYIGVFFCKFCEIFKNTFSTEHLRATASEFYKILESTELTERIDMKKFSSRLTLH